MSEGLNLLSAIAHNGSTVTLRLLEEEYFYTQEEVDVLRAMNRHVVRYGRVPAIEAVEETTRIQMPDVTETVDYYLDTIHRRHVYNQVHGIFGDIRQSLLDSDVDSLQEQAELIRRACRPIRAQRREIINVSEDCDDILRRYREAALRPGYSGIPFGSTLLTEDIGGAFNGDLIMYVGRPGTSKTWRLLFDAYAAHSAGYSILFITMEMPKEAIMLRLACMVASIDPDLARKGMLSFFARRRLELAVDELRTWTSFNIMSGNFDKNTRDLSGAIAEYGPDVIYIDGVYLMKPSGVNLNKINRYERVAYALDELRTVTLAVDRPIIGTTQFNRGGAKESSLETIGYTDTIATHCTGVLALKLGRFTEVITRDTYTNEEEYAEARSLVRAGNNVQPYSRITRTRQVSYYRVIEQLKNREGLMGLNVYSNFRLTPWDFSDCSEAEALGREEVAEPNLDYMT